MARSAASNEGPEGNLNVAEQRNSKIPALSAEDSFSLAPCSAACSLSQSSGERTTSSEVVSERVWKILDSDSVKLAYPWARSPAPPFFGEPFPGLPPAPFSKTVAHSPR